jgi:hypothetical protein
LPDLETQNPQAQIRRRGSFDTVAAGCFPMNPAATESPFAWCQEG